MDLGKKLINLRKEKKMTQEEVAEHLNITRQTVSNWELGSTKPDVEQLKAISKLYKVSIDNLLDNDTKEVLAQTISNTEKLAGLVYKLLKWVIILFGALFVVMVVLAVMGIIFFSVSGSLETNHVTTVMRMNCTLDETEYAIVFEEVNGELNVIVPDELDHELDLSSFEHIYEAANNIRRHFIINGGSCE